MRLVRILVLGAVLAAAPVVLAAKPAEEGNFFEKLLSELTLGEGIHAEPLVVFPLLAKDKPDPLPLLPDRESSKVRFVEPDWASKRFDVIVRNDTDRAAFVFGGTVITGGRLDRLVPRDLVVPAKGAFEIEALPARYPKEGRREAKPFEIAATVAPPFLRERARRDPSRYLVPIFISHFLDFRKPGDTRHSLEAIETSPALERFCTECHKSLARFPQLGESRVVGWVTAVRGRLASVEIFGTNELLRTYFQPTLRANAYAAAAIALRAKKVGMPVPGNADSEKIVAAARKRAEELLGRMKKDLRTRKDDLPRGSMGTALLLRTNGADGSALGLDDRLVHAVLYPENPFEEALFSRPVELPPDLSAGEESFGALDRREERGNLTEYEKRLLERMRERRRR